MFMIMRNALRGVAAAGILASGCNAPETAPKSNTETLAVIEQLEAQGYQYRGIEPISSETNQLTFRNLGFGSKFCVLAQVRVITTPENQITEIALTDERFSAGKSDVQDTYVFGNKLLGSAKDFAASMHQTDHEMCF